MMFQAPGSREERRLAVKLEQRAKRSGEWGEWRFTDVPDGIPGANPFGWCAQVRKAAANDLYVVLMRPLDTVWGRVTHCAIRTASGLEPPWRDKQRIKNELFWREATAVEVMPPETDLIDEADMYHIWILPPDLLLPFTIGKRRANPS